MAAAHRVLVTYVPAAQASLDAAYAASLARIPDGRAKDQGIAFGIRGADNLLRLRANDGRNAPILFTKAPAPGVWRPTPPAFAPMAVPNATVSRGLEDVFHTRHLDLTLISTAVPEVRHYDSGRVLRRDVVDARVWLGIHFRFADRASRDLGIAIADWVLDHYFQPVHHHR